MDNKYKLEIHRLKVMCTRLRHLVMLVFIISFQIKNTKHKMFHTCRNRWRINSKIYHNIKHANMWLSCDLPIMQHLKDIEEIRPLRLGSFFYSETLSREWITTLGRSYSHASLFPFTHASSLFVSWFGISFNYKNI